MFRINQLLALLAMRHVVHCQEPNGKFCKEGYPSDCAADFCHDCVAMGLQVNCATRCMGATCTRHDFFLCCTETPQPNPCPTPAPTTTTVTTTTITTTHAPTPSPTPPPTPLFRLDEGNCKVEGACITSPNYPLNYDNNQDCLFTTQRIGHIAAESFQTEGTHDKLAIGCRVFMGAAGGSRPGEGGPSSATVRPGYKLEWSSDGSVTRKGWKICPTTSIDFLQRDSATGPCTVGSDNCWQSPNYPSNYGDHQACSVDVGSEAVVNAADFNTEYTHDYLTIATSICREYTGATGPTGLDVVLGETIHWHSDYSVLRKGWKICSIASPCDTSLTEVDVPGNRTENYVEEMAAEIEAAKQKTASQKAWALAAATKTKKTNTSKSTASLVSDVSEVADTGTIKSTSAPALFTLDEGACKIEGACITSPGYPSDYDNSQDCMFTAHTKGYIAAESFQTEATHDKLAIGCRVFMGASGGSRVGEGGPTSQKVKAGYKLEWSTDGSVTRKGWKICPTTSADDWLERDTATGPCSVSSDNCWQSPSYPSNYADRQYCSIDIGGETEVSSQEFNTEYTHDYLTIATGTCHEYAGVTGPDGVHVDPGDVIHWHSDSSVVRKGWKICSIASPCDSSLTEIAVHERRIDNDDDEISAEENAATQKTASQKASALAAASETGSSNSTRSTAAVMNLIQKISTVYEVTGSDDSIKETTLGTRRLIRRSLPTTK